MPTDEAFDPSEEWDDSVRVREERDEARRALAGVERAWKQLADAMFEITKAIGVDGDGSDLAPVVAKVNALAMRGLRQKPPDTREDGTNHAFRIAGMKFYVIANAYEDGTPCEIFLRVGDEHGTLVAGLLDGIALSTSIALQHGVPLKSITSKWRHTKFEPAGVTGQEVIPMASSLLDYLAAYLEKRFGLESP